MNSVVIFDLDDTLIDTRRVLLPDALERVSAATGIDVGGLNARGKRIEEVLEGLEVEADIRDRAAAAWYDPRVPPIEPLPGARELLAALRGKVRLFLLTRGDEARQANKIRACGLAPYFEDTIIRPIEKPGSKRDDILAILERCDVAPDRCAVVGDDPRDELAYARELGCLAIAVPATPLSAVPGCLKEAGLCSA